MGTRDYKVCSAYRFCHRAYFLNVLMNNDSFCHKVCLSLILITIGGWFAYSESLGLNIEIVPLLVAAEFVHCKLASETPKRQNKLSKKFQKQSKHKFLIGPNCYCISA